eukprot:8092678-Pyramimonas_sp.AAC.2
MSHTTKGFPKIRHLTYRITTLSGSHLAVVIDFPPWTNVASAAEVESDIDENGVFIQWPHCDPAAQLKVTWPLVGVLHIIAPNPVWMC